MLARAIRRRAAQVPRQVDRLDEGVGVNKASGCVRRQLDHALAFAGSPACHESVNLVALSAVKLWLRDCLVLTGGIQAKAPARPGAHRFLNVATTPFHRRSGDFAVRDRAERQTHRLS